VAMATQEPMVLPSLFLGIFQKYVWIPTLLNATCK